MLREAGEFPHAEACAVFAGRGTANVGAASVVLPNGAASVVVESTLESHLLMDVKFDVDLFTNDAKFYRVSTSPPLSHARDVSSLAAVYDSRATLTSGYSGNAALFDGESALVSLTPNRLLPDGVDITGATICFWMRRLSSLDTLYPTLFAIGDAFALRFYAFYQDVSMVANGDTVRASGWLSQSAQPGLAWAHVCASTASGGRSVLYFNGTRVGESAVTQSWTGLTSSAVASVGGTGDPGVTSGGHDRGFGGMVDELRYWGRQLSDSEVRAVYGV
jgi:hypothetical protein